MNLTIGSGDISALMIGKSTKGYQDFIRKFVEDGKPYYNALASPIDALRTGAILEDRYLLTLPDNYYIQVKVTCIEMDVFTSSLDFAKIEKGVVSDFDELKTLSFFDFIEIIEPLRFSDEKEYLPVIKKTFKKYYNQVQCQLMCSGIEECNLVFLAVETYDDEENFNRVISENDYIKFRIKKDEKAISEIKKRGEIFQQIKNHFNE